MTNGRSINLVYSFSRSNERLNESTRFIADFLLINKTLTDFETHEYSAHSFPRAKSISILIPKTHPPQTTQKDLPSFSASLLWVTIVRPEITAKIAAKIVS